MPQLKVPLPPEAALIPIAAPAELPEYEPFPYQPGAVELAPALYTTDNHRPLRHVLGLVVETVARDNGAECISADDTRQLIYELITNAIRFGGGVTKVVAQWHTKPPTPIDGRDTKDNPEGCLVVCVGDRREGFVEDPLRSYGLDRPETAKAEVPRQRAEAEPQYDESWADLVSEGATGPEDRQSGQGIQMAAKLAIGLGHFICRCADAEASIRHDEHDGTRKATFAIIATRRLEPGETEEAQLAA